VKTRARARETEAPDADKGLGIYIEFESELIAEPAKWARMLPIMSARNVEASLSHFVKIVSQRVQSISA
jgi:hypothetical protein